jgi:hypothetical protein
MKITKAKLKQLIKEELTAAAIEEEPPQTMETLLEDLQEMLKNWQACDDDPGGMACRYHKDLENIIVKYNGVGCAPGTHDASAHDEDNPQHGMAGFFSRYRPPGI